MRQTGNIDRLAHESLNIFGTQEAQVACQFDLRLHLVEGAPSLAEKNRKPLVRQPPVPPPAMLLGNETAARRNWLLNPNSSLFGNSAVSA